MHGRRMIEDMIVQFDIPLYLKTYGANAKGSTPAVQSVNSKY